MNLPGVVMALGFLGFGFLSIFYGFGSVERRNPLLLRMAGGALGVVGIGLSLFSVHQLTLALR